MNRLIGYWTGNDTPNDSSSNGLTAAWVGTPAYIAGSVGDAFSFNGSIFVSVPINPLFAFKDTDAFRLSFFFSIADITVQSALVWKGTYVGGLTRPWGIEVSDSSEKLVLHCDDDSIISDALPGFANNTFFQVVVTYNNGYWNMWFAGTQVVTNWHKKLAPDEGTNLYFGAASSSDSLTRLIGAIDEIKLYNDNPEGGNMGTNALNQVYKTAIVAVEECLLAADATPTATTLIIAGNYMTATPFVVGREYILRDNTFSSTSEGVPNAEKIQVTSVTSMVATPKGDGIGYAITGAIGVIGSTVNGFSGGVIGTYAMTSGASILTPGVEMAIQSADFNCRFKTLTDAPKVDFDDEASRFATGDEGRDAAIAGARYAEINFTEKLSWAGTVIAVPTWAKLMRTMGHAVKTYSTKGIGFLPHTWANETTATIWIIAPENGMNPTSTVYRYCGAHGGNGSSISVGKIGDVWTLTGKYSAAYVGTKEIAFSAARALTSPDSKAPEVMLSNQVTVPAVFGHSCTPHSYATVAALVTAEVLTTGSYFFSADGTDTTDVALATAKGSAVFAGDVFKALSASTCSYVIPQKTVEISQFSLDFGGVVNPFIDQGTATGNAYYATQDRDPRFSCNPYHVRKSADDIDFVVTQMVTGPLTVASAFTAPHITIEIPNAQLLSPELASREGYINTNRVYRCLRNNTGAGIKESALPAQAMYEILIGARA